MHITTLIRGPAFKPADRIGAMHDEVDLQRPEHEEARELADRDVEERQRRAVQRVAREDIGERIDRAAAEPGLDAVPAARDDRTQHRGQLCALRAERRPHKHRIRNAVLGACMADQQHRHEHDQVAEQHGRDRLPRRHALFREACRKHVRCDVHHHPDPQRGEVIPLPRALRGTGRREIVVIEAAALRAGREARIDGMRSLLHRGSPLESL
jgi:hypothetical protein